MQVINADGSISVRTLAERDLMRRGGCPMVGEWSHRRYINRLAGEDSESVKTLAWGGEIGRGGRELLLSGAAEIGFARTPQEGGSRLFVCDRVVRLHPVQLGWHLENQQAPEHPQLPIYSCTSDFAEIAIVAMHQQRVIEDLPSTVKFSSAPGHQV